MIDGGWKMYSLTNQALRSLELTLSEVHVGNCVFWYTWAFLKI